MCRWCVPGPAGGSKQITKGSGDGPDCGLLVEPNAIIETVCRPEGQTYLVGKCGTFFLRK